MNKLSFDFQTPNDKDLIMRKRTLSLTIIASVALSGCTSILQSYFDEEAEKSCHSVPREDSSVHLAAKSNCVNGKYAPEPKEKSEWKNRGEK